MTIKDLLNLGLPEDTEIKTLTVFDEFEDDFKESPCFIDKHDDHCVYITPELIQL